MGDRGPRIGARSSYRQIHALRLAEIHTEPRTLGKRNASKFSGPTCLVFVDRFGRELIKLPSLTVRCNLCIPGFPVVLQKPVTQLDEFVSRQVTDLLFNLFDLAHAEVSGVPSALHRRNW